MGEQENIEAHWEEQLIARAETAERERDKARALVERLTAALVRTTNQLDSCEYGDGPPCPGDPPYVDVCPYCEGVTLLATDAAAPAETKGDDHDEEPPVDDHAQQYMENPNSRFLG